jgi:uncharacterized membrane protein YbaN (DUF454 family)
MAGNTGRNDNCVATRMPKRHGRHPVIRVLRNIGGVLLVLLGIVGLVLPFLQGILFLVMGLALIDVPQKQAAHRWLQRFGWYRWLARKHHAVWRAWKRRRRLRRQARRAAGQAQRAGRGVGA